MKKQLFTIVLMLSALLISCSNSDSGNSAQVTEAYRIASKPVAPDGREYFVLHSNSATGKVEYFKFSITNESTAPVRNESVSSCVDFYTKGNEVWEMVLPLSSNDEIAVPILDDGSILADENFSPDIAALSGSTLKFVRTSKAYFEALYNDVDSVGATVARCTP